MPATVAALNALALVASRLPKLNPPIPIYAIIASDTFFPLTIPSSWGEFSPRFDVALSDYPVENGTFANYNKVKRPTSVTVQLIKTGSDVARFAWLAAIQQMEAEKPTQLYTIISPQSIFVDYTIGPMNYETRQDKGSNMLYLSITFVEVPQIPSSAGQKDNTAEAKAGPVQQLGRLYTNAVGAATNLAANAKSYITG